MKEKLSFLLSSLSHVFECLATDPRVRCVMPSEMNSFNQENIESFIKKN